MAGKALFMSESNEMSVIVALSCKVLQRPRNKSHWTAPKLHKEAPFLLSVPTLLLDYGSCCVTGGICVVCVTVNAFVL